MSAALPIPWSISFASRTSADSTRKPRSDGDGSICSFCHEVVDGRDERKIVSGPPGTAICSSCARGEHDPLKVLKLHSGPHYCNFCGREEHRRRSFLDRILTWEFAPYEKVSYYRADSDCVICEDCLMVVQMLMHVQVPGSHDRKRLFCNSAPSQSSPAERADKSAHGSPSAESHDSTK